MTVNQTTASAQLNNPRTYNDPIIKDLVTFISDSTFQAEFDSFFMRHCRTFCDDEEQRFEYYDIYMSFQSLFEDRIEEFLITNNLERKDFLGKLRSPDGVVLRAREKGSRGERVVLARRMLCSFLSR